MAQMIFNTLGIVALVSIFSLGFEKIALRIKVQRVVFEIILGVVIGSTVISGVVANSYIEQIAVLGSIVLLFSVGFGSNFEHLTKKKKEIVILASAGVVLPFIFVLLSLFGMHISLLPALFISAAGVSTSVGIAARILLETDNCDTDIGNIILGADVLDDIYGIVLLSLLISFVKPSVYLSPSFVLIAVLLFFSLITILFVFKRWSKNRLADRHRKYILTPSSAALPFVASFFGFSPILGAFFSGLLLSDLRLKERNYKILRVIYRILVPVFFVYIGSRITINQFINLHALLIGLLITGMIFIGQGVAGLTLSGLVGYRKSLAVGLGMLPRGEVALIIATTALGLGVVSQELFSSILIMVFATAIIEPIIFPKLLDMTKHAN